LLRIKELREEHGLQQKMLAIDLNVSQPTICDWESGKKLPSFKSTIKIADYFSVSTDYLLGKTNIRMTIPPKAIRVPVLGRIAAGIPIEAIEDILDWEEIPADMGKGGAEFFALQITGDSMSPDYIEGDVVIFQKTVTCESGDECAVIVNGEDATFKKVIKRENGIMLQPINAAKYEPEFYNNEQIEYLPVNVIGIARQLRRNK
jgi:repressor LexA